MVGRDCEVEIGLDRGVVVGLDCGAMAETMDRGAVVGMDLGVKPKVHFGFYVYTKVSIQCEWRKFRY